jgi:magnesium transporter
MLACLIPKAVGRLQPIRPATFILKKNLLLTVRFFDFFSFERMADNTSRNLHIATAKDVFFQILEEIVSDRADSLERSMRHLEVLTSQLFSSQAEEKSAEEGGGLAGILKGIGAMGSEVSIIRESIASVQRCLNFARMHLPEARQEDMAGIMDSIRNDLIALSDEASFFMNKLSFNLDATLGMINIEETKVIRFLSIITLALSPPLLIAGVYGMNFDFIPELGWKYGYFATLAIMAFTSLTAIWYLRRRKWF